MGGLAAFCGVFVDVGKAFDTVVLLRSAGVLLRSWFSTGRVADDSTRLIFEVI